MDIVEVHQIIVKKLKDIFLEQNCVIISKLANDINMDQRTVKRHLKIVEIDKFGHFADKDEKIFCKEGA